MPARMKLSSVYSTLPPAERKVADFILSDPDRAAHMVINDIAREAGVSVPSVTRLARKLGYSGFMDFRVSLASGTSTIKHESKLPISSSDSDELLIQKLMIGHMTAIESTLRVLDTAGLTALAEEICKCRRVVWFCVGNCVQLAINVSDGLCRMGIDSVVIDNRSVMETYAGCLGKGDLAIGLTRTGKTQHTIDSIRIAKEKGARTAFVTNLVNSVAEQYADHFICTSRQDDLYRICGYETGTAMCALLESFLIIIGRKKRAIANLPFYGAMNPKK
ncbi:MAG: MurR/RpiR family transcriptional regulator [Clostridiales bacterium]|nr:MurR/RpiR family transcriptional regulator [Clostridiales bacterium]